MYQYDELDMWTNLVCNIKKQKINKEQKKVNNLGHTVLTIVCDRQSLEQIVCFVLIIVAVVSSKSTRVGLTKTSSRLVVQIVH